MVIPRLLFAEIIKFDLSSLTHAVLSCNSYVSKSFASYNTTDVVADAMLRVDDHNLSRDGLCPNEWAP